MRQKRGKKVEKGGAERRLNEFEERILSQMDASRSEQTFTYSQEYKDRFDEIIEANVISGNSFTVTASDNNTTTHSLSHSINEHWGKE